MGRKPKYTIDEIVGAVLDYKNGKKGITQICNDLGLHRSGSLLYKWIRDYDK